MPIRKTNFQEDGYYHIYNRGVEKRDIFLSEEDYQAFFDILRSYLSPSLQIQGRALQRIRSHRLDEEVKLLSFSLMPNHFHLLFQQKNADSLTNLMRRVLTAYSMYFNEKYDRVGSLFQGRFRAKEVLTDEYLLHLSRYIHLNPVKAGLVTIGNLSEFNWSSYGSYLERTKQEWINSDLILNYFPDREVGYKDFVENSVEEVLPKELLLESD